MDTWITLKLLHSKHTLDNNLNIWHIIQVASLTKRRVEGEKGRCIVPCWSLADYWVLSPFKCTVSHSTTWILCSFLAQEGGGQEVISLGFAACSAFWPCNWKWWTTSWTWASHWAALNLSFQICGTEKAPCLPTWMRHHGDKRGSRRFEFLGGNASYNERLFYI